MSRARLKMNAEISVSVVLCTHDPNPETLRRSLAALEAQSLPAADWELIVVDNASSAPLAGRIDLRWHQRGRIVREEQLGLTPARLRGIQESVGEILVLVDDDNILASGYLEAALQLGRKHAQLGAWGGSCIGEFAAPPERWAGPYLPYLAIRDVPQFVWSNLYDFRCMPFGAGLCVRRGVAEAYAANIQDDELRRGLDRRGGSLASGGDSDLAFTAIDCGLGIGLSPALSLRHIMSRSRLEAEYLERLLESIAYSTLMVLHVHGITSGAPRISRLEKMIAEYRLLRQPGPVRRMEKARDRGAARAYRELGELKNR